MVDFLMISTRSTKRGVLEIYPKFIIKKSADLMIRGGDFYAIWLEDSGLWSTDEHDALQLIDRELDKYASDNKSKFDSNVKVLHMWDAESGMVDAWHKYCQKQMRDSFCMLDEKLIFSNYVTSKKDYASRKLSYPLEAGSIDAYDKLISTLYTKEERHKIEWAIGSIVSGDSKKIQKFMVLYGSAGTGKSTILNIIQQLFEGYYSVFDAKALGNSSNSFALEAFKTNPLVAIQHDGDLSKIEDNTRLNSLVSHELMTVNEKFKSTYSNRFKCFLFMGTNRPVKITDAKSGLIRRLIDVSPSGDRLTPSEYEVVVKQVDFELGAIAHHCHNVYLSNPGYYDSYIPTAMLGASNDFYNFVIDSYHVFKKEDGTTLKAAWEIYKNYCDEAKVPYPHSQRIFKEELRTYFRDYKDRFSLDDGTRVRSYYSGFRTEKFEDSNEEVEVIESSPTTIEFKKQSSILDDMYKDCQAQYATSNETPYSKWEEVKSTLSDLDTGKLHYVRLPDNHIVIDFDIKGSDGNKNIELNLKEASKWPPTYSEVSKSGQGIHLHYIYTGDSSLLSRIYENDIEIKVFTGKSSLRRKLTKCNGLKIETISSGLPTRGETKMVSTDILKSEKGLRTLIKRNLNKEIHHSTKSSIDFIFKILEDAYNSDLYYGVEDMRNAVLAFAASSTNQSDYCIKLVSKMKFQSKENSNLEQSEDIDMVFYDVEVFPNLFIVNWKVKGDDKVIVRMVNPTPTEIEDLIRYRLVGFNCRRYDNHILYARLMGYTNEQLYSLSQKIISGSRNAFFGEAYNLSYTDVYDFSSKKQSLKKFQIELGLHHKELGLPWDQPVPEHLWPTVAEYCDNDVYTTEATFDARLSDFQARQILSKVAGMTVNDTTNSLTTRIIFGKDRQPQGEFNYRDMGDVEDGKSIDNYDEYTMFDSKKRPIFPGYKFDFGKSTYRGEEVGEGGYVYAEPGMYGDVAVLDVASMHPFSIISENLFGDKYTGRFKEIVEARIAIKHEDFDKAKKLLGGVLSEYINDKKTASDLSTALKIAINSVYGLTSARFDNPFRDKRNIDNIVAKRGALFMINLKHEVQKRGFVSAHIKTDSIKIPDATVEIINFVSDYGKLYGYTFEHEATYDKLCLVNNAVYIAKHASKEKCEELYGYIPGDNFKKENTWTATGTQFQVPYVFKKLFSKEEVIFEDLCETKSVTSTMYLDMNEDLPDVSEQEKTVAFAVKKAKEFGVTIDISKPTGDGEIDPLLEEIAKGHNYIFIGKVGLFCPIKENHGGGILLRETLNKKTGEKGYASVTGTKGYKWLESEMVSELGKEESIDVSYYDKLVDDAVIDISKYGDFEWFVSDDPYIQIEKKDDDLIHCKDLDGDKSKCAECYKGYDCIPF